LVRETGGPGENHRWFINYLIVSWRY
jgi:hypothetical protein